MVKFWKGTKAKYDELKSGGYDKDKLYFITDVNNGIIYLGDKLIADDSYSELLGLSNKINDHLTWGQDTDVTPPTPGLDPGKSYFIIDVLDNTSVTAGGTNTSFIDWGDSSSENTNNGDISHIYKTAGKYEVVITHADNATLTLPKEHLIEIKSIGKLTSLSRLCQMCMKLSTLPNDMFKNNPNVSNIDFMFDMCLALNSIPADLLKSCSKLTSAVNAFSSCDFADIPSGLFNNCTSLTSVYNMFKDNTSLINISENLFSNCNKLEYVSNLFQGCISLETIPSTLFKNCSNISNADYLFDGCEMLTSIPSGIFNDTVNLSSISYMFGGCWTLNLLPEGLFDNCKKLSNVSYAFDYCESLNTPYNLTSTGKKKLWERNGDIDGEVIADYMGFGSGTGTLFSSSLPAEWR